MQIVLRSAIEAEIEGVSLRTLQRAVETLSTSYRSAAPTPVRQLDDLERLAYLVVRMPATHAAISTVLRDAAQTLPEPVTSLLDLGAGPGTTLWAAAEVFPALQRATLLDRDAAMLAIGARLWSRHERSSSIDVEWRAAHLDGRGELASADLVTLSYIVGELSPEDRRHAIERALQAARIAVVVIEPGTPHGYRAVIEARTALVARGASIAGPCPHSRPCPLTGSDWCHFAVRLERSRAHRLLKDAQLGWEDEKYSFVVATTRALPPGASRILRRPLVEKGRIALKLCAPGGIEDLAITRKDPDLWRAARHARWGDRWAGT
jgi:ribosomal protein RSM22 (predicted rRNA methylase)